MYTNSRENEVRLLKQLWAGLPTMCPKCRQAELVHLHKKAKNFSRNANIPEKAIPRHSNAAHRKPHIRRNGDKGLFSYCANFFTKVEDIRQRYKFTMANRQRIKYRSLLQSG